MKKPENVTISPIRLSHKSNNLLNQAIADSIKSGGKKNIKSWIIDCAIDEFLDNQGVWAHLQRLGIKPEKIDITDYLIQNIKEIKVNVVNFHEVNLSLDGTIDFNCECNYTSNDEFTKIVGLNVVNDLTSSNMGIEIVWDADKVIHELLFIL